MPLGPSRFLGFLGKGFLINKLVKWDLSSETWAVRSSRGEQRTIPLRVAAAPRRTSSWVSCSMLRTQTKRAFACEVGMMKRWRK